MINLMSGFNVYNLIQSAGQANKQRSTILMFVMKDTGWSQAGSGDGMCLEQRSNVRVSTFTMNFHQMR